MNTAEFWVFLAFITFFGLFGKKIFAVICEFLDEYIASVKTKLNDSKKQKSDSIKILNDAKSKGDMIQKDIEDLKLSCDKNIKNIEQNYKDTLERYKINSEKQLQSDIEFEINESKKRLSEKVKSEVISSVKEKFKEKKFDIKILKNYKDEISELLK